MSTHSAYQEAGISLHNLCVIITLLYLPEGLRKQQMIPFFSRSFGKAIIFVPVQEKNEIANVCFFSSALARSSVIFNSMDRTPHDIEQLTSFPLHIHFIPAK